MCQFKRHNGRRFQNERTYRRASRRVASCRVARRPFQNEAGNCAKFNDSVPRYVSFGATRHPAVTLSLLIFVGQRGGEGVEKGGIPRGTEGSLTTFSLPIDGDGIINRTCV